MARFYFVLSGDNILLDRAGAEPVVGFVARRGCRAASLDAAEKRVKIELLKNWKQTFNQDNKVGTPSLKIAYSRRIRNPLKKVRAGDDFQFFNNNSQRDELLEQAKQAARRWFFIR